MFTDLLGFLFSLSWVDGACSDLQDEGGSFWDKFSLKKGYRFMQKFLGLYLLVGGTENVTEVIPVVSLFASVVVCGAGGKDWPWFGALWDL